MQKIPTMFERGPDHKVTNIVRADCQWVIDGEGVATEKLDGTNVRLTIRNSTCVRLEKRRNPLREQKFNGITWPWYVDAWVADAIRDPSNQHVIAAMQGTNFRDWPDGEHVAEAIGPKIQGNPLGLEKHVCVPFLLGAAELQVEDLCRTFLGLRNGIFDADSVYSPGNQPEGIVFHHPDGRMAKIKRKDF